MAFMQVDFFSEVLGMCTHMNVILPEENKGAIGMDGTKEMKSWKVLYLLHGLSDDYTIWQRQTSIERHAAGKPVVIVMPETQRGWYTDMKYGFKWFTYFTEELPVIVKNFFPRVSTKREDTFVAGLSMGGYGAMKMGLGDPEHFSACASLSGALDVCKYLRGEDERHRYFSNIFGDLDELEGSDNDLFALAGKLKAEGKPVPKVFMWCGTEDGLLDSNERFSAHLDTLGIDHVYNTSSGDHQWQYWDDQIKAVLDWLPLRGR